MALADQIDADIKAAMLAKEKDKLESLRAIKSALLLAATEKGAEGKVSDEASLKVVQRLVKQRKEAADIFTKEGREDLAQVELSQAATIEVYLPEQMGEAEVKEAIEAIIAETGASTIADMGKVMGPAMAKLGGKADGKLVSDLVKKLLSK